LPLPSWLPESFICTHVVLHHHPRLGSWVHIHAQQHATAAIKIQAKFRGDQARKCLRRIQAEVLGEIFVYIQIFVCAMDTQAPKLLS